jgi:hypothetical protein
MAAECTGMKEVDPSELEEVGYQRPPKSTQFQKGRSGNPRGRPKNRKRGLPYDHVLGQMVTVREDGREKRVTAAEAFLLHLTKKGLEGDGVSARSSLAALEGARSNRIADGGHLQITRIIFATFGPGLALGNLGMAVKRYGSDKEKARWDLKAWIVEAALARMGPNSLTPDEQREVWNATYKTETVKWPAWWTYRG